jgi:imidazolonepropionase-like amidohydrolase
MVQFPRPLFVFVPLALGVTAPLIAQDRTLIRNVTVIDGSGRPARPGMDVLFARGRIAAVRGTGGVPPSGAVVVDGTGKYLVPGFIDVHVHAAAGPFVIDSSGARPTARLVYDETVATEILASLRRFGVTTTRIPGGPTDHAVALKRAVAAGRIPGPRIVTAGNLIDTGTFPGLTTTVRTESDVRAEVDRQAAAGVDLVKLYSELPPSLVKAGIEEAHRKRLKALGHLSKTSWTEAARFGIDEVVHIIAGSPDLLPPERRAAYRAIVGPKSLIGWLAFLDLGRPEIDTMITELARHRVRVNPTLVVYDIAFHRDDPRYTSEQPDLPFAPSRLRADWPWMSAAGQLTAEDYQEGRAAWPKALELTRVLHRRGVELTVGTDAPNPWVVPGASFHRELALFVEAGIPPLEVLTLATRNGARALGLEAEVGTLAVGKRADAILLDADPVADIRNTRRISRVFQDGRPVAGQL